MNMDLNKIIKLHGKDNFKILNDNKKEVFDNLTYFVQLGFDDIEDIFERYNPIFICDSKEFVNKINKLIKKLGNNYVEIIENNLSLLEELL